VPRFAPFAGIRYNPQVDLDAATAPPYDVIDADERSRLAGQHPANAVHVDLPDEAEGPSRYDTAAQMLTWMRDEEILVVDHDPAFYVYRMDSVDDDGVARHCTGVLGALTLSRPGEGEILPHEHTTPKAKSDRLDLLRATHHNLSPIWGLTPTHGLTALCATDGPADGEATDEEGVRHRLWRVTERDRLDAISALVASAPIVVADGHHRYETSLAFRDERQATDGAGPWDATLAFVVELTEDELAVRPIHRLLDRLPDDLDVAAALATHFDAEPTGADAGLPARMEAAGALGLLRPGGRAWLLRPKRGAFPADLADLDSSRLAAAAAELPAHEVRYQHGTANVLRMVAAGEASAGVLLRPATVPQIKAIAEGGERMPPKTTFFWPKPRTGFVFRSLES
jgi:uncharacterized protein (DUF1015 family)